MHLLKVFQVNLKAFFQPKFTVACELWLQVHITPLSVSLSYSKLKTLQSR